VGAAPREVLDIDGKFLRTLRLLLLRPGLLASEYVAGRRQRYVGLLRFYVIAFLLHATLAALLVGHGLSLSEHIRESDPTQLLGRLAASRSGLNWNDSEIRASLNERGRWFSEIGTMLIFLAIAALQKLIFFGTGRRYLEHVALSRSTSYLSTSSFCCSSRLVSAFSVEVTLPTTMSMPKLGPGSPCYRSTGFLRFADSTDCAHCRRYLER
jgi:hypothetical protein